MYYSRCFLLLCLLLSIAACDTESISPAANADDILAQEQIQASEMAVENAKKEIQSFAEEWIEFRDPVVVPAGSVDALAGAIAEAGAGGTVVLASGVHTENAAVLVEQRVKIEGETGAILHFPNSPEPVVLPSTELLPAIHVRNASRAWLKGFTIATGTEKGGRLGVIIEDAPRTRLEGLQVVGFQYGIFLDGGNRCQIIHNTVVGSFAEYPEAGNSWGIINSTGQRTVMFGNEVSNYNTCIFFSDRNGLAFSNTTVGGGVGVLWCTVPAWQFYPDGRMVQAAEPARGWRCYNHTAIGAFWNYLIIDGAKNSVSIQNESIEAGLYDIEIASASERFGFPTPTSTNSLVISVGDHVDYRIKDCTGDNTIVGGQMVDTTTDPCF